MKSVRKEKKRQDVPPVQKVPLWRDALEVVISLVVILVVLRLLLGANMPVPLVAVVSCSMLHEDDAIGSLSYAFASATGPLFAEGNCVYDAGSSWRQWLEGRVPGIGIESFPLKSGFSVGDMILVTTADGKGTVFPLFSETRVGDVIIFRRDERSRGSEPIIHRVIGTVKVKDRAVASTEGTLDCFTVQEFESRFIPYVNACRQGSSNCPYGNYPKGDEYSFYLTKGDNNKGSDQCNGMLPIPDSQVIAKGWIRIPYLGWLKLFLNRLVGLVFWIVSMPFGG